MIELRCVFLDFPLFHFISFRLFLVMFPDTTTSPSQPHPSACGTGEVLVLLEVFVGLPKHFPVGSIARCFLRFGLGDVQGGENDTEKTARSFIIVSR